MYAWPGLIGLHIVIRLKQVEHIKNERNTLAAVAGHPFITTMITSFSDKDCLYMLVCKRLTAERIQHLTCCSLTSVLAERSSHTYVGLRHSKNQ